MKHARFLESLRWLVSLVFFFLALSKGRMIMHHGLRAYEMFCVAAGWPVYLKYYGVVAVALEFSLAVGVWFKKPFKTVILCSAGLSLTGIGVSLYSLIYRVNSDCGCGLLGDNEYGLLFQKGLIVLVLFVLYQKQAALSFE